MSFRQVVDGIFADLAPERAANLAASTPEQTAARIRAAMAHLPPDVAHDVAFHMTDWASDAAFVVALLLFPERFSDTEVRNGVQQFLAHAPNHIVAAAKLAGEPARDVFGVGALDGEGEA